MRRVKRLATTLNRELSNTGDKSEENKSSEMKRFKLKKWQKKQLRELLSRKQKMTLEQLRKLQKERRKPHKIS
jgi:antitoxin component HigA of HigAB toxin-antitoxin module